MKTRMTLSISTATLVLGTIAFAKLLPTPEDEFRPIAHDRQLFSEWTLRAIEDEASRVDWISKWPGIVGNRDVVTSDRIPDDVRNEAGLWMHKVVRRDWIPPTWPQNLVGVRKHYAGMDVLADRFSKGAYDFQLIEHGSGLNLLVRPHTEPLRGNAPVEDFMALIKRCAAELTRFPEDKLGNASISITPRATDGTRILYAGAMDCEYEAGRTENWSWWNHMLVWTDGEVVSLGIAKMDGQPRGRQAIASTGKRFKDGG